MKIFQGKGPLIFAPGLLENSYEGPWNSWNTEPRENPKSRSDAVQLHKMARGLKFRI